MASIRTVTEQMYAIIATLEKNGKVDYSVAIYATSGSIKVVLQPDDKLTEKDITVLSERKSADGLDIAKALKELGNAYIREINHK